jgi:hypothetical protein
MFRFWKRSPEPVEKKIAVENQDSEIEESLQLVTGSSRAEVDKTESVVRQRVQEVAREELRELKMIEDGRCPNCARKLEMFLYTSICKSCGWNTHITPRKNSTIVRLRTGNTIRCDRVYNAEHEALCVRNSVVVSRVPRENIDYVEFTWSRDEIEDKLAKLAAEQGGICAWCGGSLAPSPGEEGEPQKNADRQADNGSGPDRIALYVAFGAWQEKHFFCSQKCLESFKRQHPTRVHRNCYETECADCDACMKRFDVPRGQGNLSRLMDLMNGSKSARR